MNKQATRAFIIIFVIILIICFFYFDLTNYLTLSYLKSNKELLLSYYLENKTKTLLIYFLIYVLTTSLSLPGASALTLAGGAIFGFTYGLILVSFASSIGATLAFLLSRYLFRNYVQSKFSNQLKIFNEGMEKEGSFYLFSLRLIPIFPFFLINILMGLTPIHVFKYYYISQLGMIFGTIIYVNAGVQLSKIESLSDILSPTIIGSFVLLGLLPIITKRLLVIFKTKNPKQ